MPPSTRSALPAAKASTARCAAAPLEQDFLRLWFLVVGRQDVAREAKLARRLACAGDLNGPVPSPVRTIAISGCASNASRFGPRRSSRISITRSVIATMSSTAPSVSLSGSWLRGPICALQDPRDLLRGDLAAVRPLVAASRKM